eukprot:7008843-Alexandrium_andersonii.AAC.1
MTLLLRPRPDRRVRATARPTRLPPQLRRLRRQHRPMRRLPGARAEHRTVARAVARAVVGE